jgi:hypothetical protein
LIPILQNQGQSCNRNSSDLNNSAKNRLNTAEWKGVHFRSRGSVRGIVRGVAATRLADPSKTLHASGARILQRNGIDLRTNQAMTQGLRQSLAAKNLSANTTASLLTESFIPP